MAKRRANGEGSIRKRKDGRWEGRYTAGRDPVTGKVIYKNVLGRTQAEVKAKLKAAIEANTNLDIVKAEQYTVGQWMDVWFENCAKIKVRPSSHQTYRGYIDNHIKPNIGSVPLSKVSSLHLQQLYKKILTGGRVETAQGSQRQDSAGHQSGDLLGNGFCQGSETDRKQPNGRLRPAEAGAQRDEDVARRAADLFPAGGEGDRRL